MNDKLTTGQKLRFLSVFVVLSWFLVTVFVLGVIDLVHRLMSL